MDIANLKGLVPLLPPFPFPSPIPTAWPKVPVNEPPDRNPPSCIYMGRHASNT